MKTGINLSRNYEAASGDVRDAVGSLRKQGFKTIAAIFEVARAIGINQARVRRLFFQEGDTRIHDAERRAIREAVIRHHRRLAARHRELAAIEETIANCKETEKLLNQLSSGETNYGRGVDSRKTICRAA